MYWQQNVERDGRQWSWWPGVTKDIGKYVDGYDVCQRIKNWTKTPAGKLMANKILEKP